MAKKTTGFYNLIDEASIIYKSRFKNDCYFERAIFLSWYCSKADCKFCFMSTQKGKIKKVPLNMAKRRPESLITEAILCKELGWNIEFLSGGYDSYNDKELLDIVRKIYHVYGRKLWLNIGLLSETQLKLLKPYTEGVCGSIECINPRLHDELCPSKPIAPIAKMLDYSRKQGLKTSITLIIGLGETIKDFDLLKRFIKKHALDRITFYALNPHDTTIFQKGPDSNYYAECIAKTRISFPDIEIIAGSWVDRLAEISTLLSAGANSITKFPATSMFNNKFAREIEHQVKISGRKFHGTLTKLPDIDWNRKIGALPTKVFDIALKSRIKAKMQSYLVMMRKKKK